MIENRKSPRYPVKRITADITDSIRVFSYCNVINVSRKGLLISDIPNRILKYKLLKSNIFNTIINYDNVNIRLILSPRWSMPISNNNYVHIGFEIINELSQWNSFIMDKLKIANYYGDVWGKQGLKYLRG
jgi:hypothetical protein